MWLSLKNSMGNTSQFMQMFAQFSEMRINHGILKGTMRYHEVPYFHVMTPQSLALPRGLVM